MNKIEEIKEYIHQEEENEREVGMVIFDDELSAKQIRNIEAELKKNIRHSRFLMRHQSVHISRLQQMFLLLHLFSHRPLRLSLPLPRKTPRL